MIAGFAARLRERAGRVVQRGQLLFDSRTRRERVMLLAGAVALLWALADGLWIHQAISRLQQGRIELRERDLRMQAAQSELDAATQELQLVEQAGQVQLGDARRRNEALRESLLNESSGLVSAEQMTALLQELLVPGGCRAAAASAPCSSHLRIRSMRSLAPDAPLSGAAPVAAAPAASAAARAASAPAETALPGLWQHGLEIVIEGSFRELQDYVLRLEALPQRLSRGGMTLTVERYPQATLTLRLSALSLDPQWLEL